MALRTVRLDDDSEKVLTELTKETGMSISAVLKEGLLALRDRMAPSSPRRPAREVYQEPDPSPGGAGEPTRRRGAPLGRSTKSSSSDGAVTRSLGPPRSGGGSRKRSGGS